jgi:ketosteroid isomerase-like protein
MTTDDREQKIRRQVEAALLSYCRGIDRLDPDAVLAAFHPGAVLIDYGPEPTTIEAFTERVIPSLRSRYRATQHRITNLAVNVDGETATAETYILAYHVQPADGTEAPAPETEAKDRLVTFNGRYIDRFTEQDGQWRITERHLRCDWSRIEVIEETMGNRWAYSGRGGTDDPLNR